MHDHPQKANQALTGAAAPVMVKCAGNPAGTPIEAFNDIRANVPAYRSQFIKDLSMPSGCRG